MQISPKTTWKIGKRDKFFTDNGYRFKSVLEIMHWCRSGQHLCQFDIFHWTIIKNKHQAFYPKRTKFLNFKYLFSKTTTFQLKHKNWWNAKIFMMQSIILHQFARIFLKGAFTSIFFFSLIRVWKWWISKCKCGYRE